MLSLDQRGNGRIAGALPASSVSTIELVVVLSNLIGLCKQLHPRTEREWWLDGGQKLPVLSGSFHH